MATDVFAIKGTLDLDSGPYKESLDSASEATKGTSGEFGNFRQAVGAVGVAVGAAGAGITMYAKHATDATVDWAKSVMQLSRETGTSTEKSSELIFVAQRMGISADEASKMFGVLSKQIIATRDAAADADTPLKSLNVQTRDADGSTRGLNEVLMDVADKFHAMPDGVEKTTIAMQLFGRSGKDMIPVLNLGRDGITELEQKAHELGLTLSGANLANVQKYIAAQKDLKDSNQALQVTVGMQTIPVMTEFNKKINDMLMGFLNTKGPVRDVGVGILAFGGPVMSATGSVAAFAGSLGGAIPLLDKMGGGMKALRTIASGGLVMSVALVGAALVLDGIQKLQGEVKNLKDSADGAKSQVDQLDKRIAGMQPGPARDRMTQLRQEADRNAKSAEAAAKYYGSWQGVLGSFMSQIFQTGDKVSQTTKKLLDMEITVAKIGRAFGVVPGSVVRDLEATRAGVERKLAETDQASAAGSKKAVDSFVNNMGQLPGRANQAVAGTPNSVSAGLSGTPAAAQSKGQSAVDQMAGVLAKTPGAAGQAVAPTPGEVNSRLSGMSGAGERHGSGLMNALKRAIEFASGGPIGAVAAVVQKIRDMLPGSDAKTGPLSTLTASGRALPATIAEGIRQNSGTLFRAMQEMTDTAASIGNIGGGAFALSTPGMAGTSPGRGDIIVHQKIEPKELTRGDMEMVGAEARYAIGMKLKGGI